MTIPPHHRPELERLTAMAQRLAALFTVHAWTRGTTDTGAEIIENLAKRLNVTTRTVRRYVTTLRLAYQYLDEAHMMTTTIDTVDVYSHSENNANPTPDKFIGRCDPRYAAFQVEKNTGHPITGILGAFEAGIAVWTPDFIYVPPRPADAPTVDPLILAYKTTTETQS